MKNPNYSISDVSSTMFITLYAIAQESCSTDPIIKDPKAVEMIEILKKKIAGSDNLIHKKILKGKYNPKLAITMSLRSRRFDLYVSDFLSKHPECTIINLGCGLDTRFYRTDNGKVTWYDIDFPEVIEIRKRFMEENSRHFFIANSILSPEWINKVQTGGPYLILAEGVFMYLTEADVKGLFHAIISELEIAEIIYEVSNRYWVDRMKNPRMKWKFRQRLGMNGGAVFSFGVTDSRYFERWSEKYEFLDEWTYFDDQEKKLGWFRLFSSFNILRKAQWILHYKIRK